MSSTNRGSDRDPLDDYPTPRWCVHRLLEAGVLPMRGLWVEPCAGAGSIIKAVDGWCENKIAHHALPEGMPSWIANEINPKYMNALRWLPGVRLATCEDAKELIVGPGARVVITNPPFTPAGEILVRMLTGAPGALVTFLQRIGWGGGPRTELFRDIKPSVYQLPQRPSFKDIVSIDPDTGKKRTSSQDSTEYAWWVFDGLGRFEILGDTPDEVRAAEKAERRAAEKAELLAAGRIWPHGPNKGAALVRTTQGTINNCAVANGEKMETCQMCDGNCPDVDKADAP